MSDKIEGKLDRIEDKIDKVIDHIGSLDITCAKQEVSLAEHIRRTNILEGDMKPVKRHVDRVEGVIKFIGLAAVLGGLVEATVQLLTYLKK